MEDGGWKMEDAPDVSDVSDVSDLSDVPDVPDVPDVALSWRQGFMLAYACTQEDG